MPEFLYTDMLPTGADDTEYRLLSADGVTVTRALGRDFLQIEPAVLTQLTSAAMHDIAHLLRPAHLRQLRSILDDPEAAARLAAAARARAVLLPTETAAVDQVLGVYEAMTT